jgi:Domain of unknown function (DUF4263)
VNVRDLINVASGEEIRDKIVELASSTSPDSVEILKEFLRYREDHTFFKQEVPRLACLALLAKGPAGVLALVQVLPQAPGSIYPVSIIEVLWHASHGRIPAPIELKALRPPPSLSAALPAETVEAAKSALRDVVAESANNDKIFSPLMTFIHQESTFGRFTASTDESQFPREVLDILAESRIRISPSVLSGFRDLIDRCEPEERYQQFLAEHPVFLDPLASVVIRKQKLGIEYVTDFVVRRLDDKYILVEIEKPEDLLFTKGDDFTASFTHAVGQVLDFQQWVDLNGAYAGRLMPNISSPRGLVIIGRSQALTPHQKNKLHRFNINSSAVSVLTYDEIAAQAERLYENIYHRSS